MCVSDCFTPEETVQKGRDKMKWLDGLAVELPRMSGGRGSVQEQLKKTRA